MTYFPSSSKSWYSSVNRVQVMVAMLDLWDGWQVCLSDCPLLRCLGVCFFFKFLKWRTKRVDGRAKDVWSLRREREERFSITFLICRQDVRGRCWVTGLLLCSARPLSLLSSNPCAQQLPWIHSAVVMATASPSLPNALGQGGRHAGYHKGMCWCSVDNAHTNTLTHTHTHVKVSPGIPVVLQVTYIIKIHLDKLHKVHLSYI